MHVLQLTKGYTCLVDDADAALVTPWRWSAYVSRNGTAYAVRSVRSGPGRQRMIWMHRELLGAGPGDEVDHREHLPGVVDNRRSNLRFCTRAQNLTNARKRRGAASPYKGVSRSGSKWRARVEDDYLGTFPTGEAAARAYDAAAAQRFGSFARLNFPP